MHAVRHVSIGRGAERCAGRVARVHETFRGARAEHQNFAMVDAHPVERVRAELPVERGGGRESDLRVARHLPAVVVEERVRAVAAVVVRQEHNIAVDEPAIDGAAECQKERAGKLLHAATAGEWRVRVADIRTRHQDREACSVIGHAYEAGADDAAGRSRHQSEYTGAGHREKIKTHDGVYRPRHLPYTAQGVDQTARRELRDTRPASQARRLLILHVVSLRLRRGLRVAADQPLRASAQICELVRGERKRDRFGLRGHGLEPVWPAPRTALRARKFAEIALGVLEVSLREPAHRLIDLRAEIEPVQRVRRRRDHDAVVRR